MYAVRLRAEGRADVGAGCQHWIMVVDELIDTLFDGRAHPLAAQMATWLAASRRFTAFVTANHTKIRKKLRTAQDPESMRDLQLELETAYLLLRERALSLVYEPQHSEGRRNPDFAVRFTTSLVFMVEVTRLRPGGPSAPLPGERFYSLLCSKLGQLSPQHSNVLVMGLDASGLPEEAVRAGMLRLQQRAENNDAAVVQRQGFGDRSDFFQHYQRLSALLVRGTPLQTGEAAILWLNPQARSPLPSRVRTALLRSHVL